MYKKSWLTFMYSVALFLGCSDQLDWNKLLESMNNPEMQQIRLIGKADLTDKSNIDAFEKYNPTLIIQEDLNNNGKVDFILPCRSKYDKNLWYVVIIEKVNDDYSLVQYFKFKLDNMYIFKFDNVNKKSIRVGQSFMSDFFTYISWDGAKYSSSKNISDD